MTHPQASGAAPLLLHYSIPGLPPHASRATKLADAIDLAQRLAAQTEAPAAILAHHAVTLASGAVVEEVSLARMVPSPWLPAPSTPVIVRGSGA